MSVINSPRDAGRFIAENSKDVKINDVGVKKVAGIMAECVKSGTYSIKSWKQQELNPSTMDEAALNWIFVSDTLNFSFWSADEEQKYVVNYKGKDHTGYWSLCAAMNRALDEKIPLTDPEYFAAITKDQLAHVLRSDSSTEIPMFEERLEVLREAGTVLMEKYGGKFLNVIKKCEHSAQSLLKIVTEDFPSYRDVTEFCGKTVAIYKRVQILIADIWACFEGQGLGEFKDIDTITMFADYRIPQALLFFDALEYSTELMEYLKKDSMMKSGDRYEVEIRGCSIWATELVNEETRRILDAQSRGGDEPDGNNRSVGQNRPGSGDLLVNSILIDHYLWDYRRERADEMTDIPFHKISGICQGLGDAEILRRFEEIERREAVNDLKYADMERRLLDVTNREQTLKERLDGQAEEIEKLRDMVAQQDARIAEIDASQQGKTRDSKGGNSDSSESDSLEIEESDEENTAKEMSRMVRRSIPETLVAFSAFLGHDQINVDRNEIIIFDSVLVNAGNGYHSSLGSFIAPFAGVYFFNGHTVASNLTRAYARSNHAQRKSCFIHSWRA